MFFLFVGRKIVTCDDRAKETLNDQVVVECEEMMKCDSAEATQGLLIIVDLSEHT